jgi:hypothetical protein
VAGPDVPAVAPALDKYAQGVVETALHMRQDILVAKRADAPYRLNSFTHSSHRRQRYRSNDLRTERVPATTASVTAARF